MRLDTRIWRYIFQDTFNKNYKYYNRSFSYYYQDYFLFSIFDF